MNRSVGNGWPSCAGVRRVAGYLKTGPMAARGETLAKYSAALPCRLLDGPSPAADRPTSCADLTGDRERPVAAARDLAIGGDRRDLAERLDELGEQGHTFLDREGAARISGCRSTRPYHFGAGVTVHGCRWDIRTLGCEC